MNKPKCKAKTASGKPCRAAARAQGYCYAHDPATRQKHARAASKGGQLKRTEVVIEHDAWRRERYTVRGVIAALRQLYEEAQAADERDARERIDLQVKILKEMRGAIKQVHEEDGTAPPQRIELIQSAVAERLDGLDLAKIRKLKEVLGHGAASGTDEPN